MNFVQRLMPQPLHPREYVESRQIQGELDLRQSGLADCHSVKS